MTREINRTATCFVAFYNDRPVAFDAWLPFFGRLGTSQKARRGHRTVTLPDFQGVGIAVAMFTHDAALWKALGYRAITTNSHPALLHGFARHPHWRITREPSRTAKGSHSVDATRATNRLTVGWEYIGPALSMREAQYVLSTWAART